MALFVFCSASGAPGVTTTVVGLALAWPRDVLLVDADRDPAQAVLAGYLGGADAGGRGLMSLAQAHREHRLADDELLSHCVPLSQTPGPRRAFLPGFTHPHSPQVFGVVWGALSQALASISAAGTDVLIDVGRVGGTGLPADLMKTADQVLLVGRSSLRSLAALRLYLPTLRESLDREGSAALSLALVGAGQPYSRREIEQQFKLEVSLTVPWDPKASAVYSDGAPEPRAFANGAYVRSLRAGATSLLAKTSERSLLIAGDV